MLAEAIQLLDPDGMPGTGGEPRELRTIIADVEVETVLVGGRDEVVDDVEAAAAQLLAEGSAVAVPKGKREAREHVSAAAAIVLGCHMTHEG